MSLDEDTLEALQAALRANQGSAAPAQPWRDAEPAEPVREPYQASGERAPQCSTGKVRFPTEAAARKRLNEIYGQSHTGRLYGPINIHGPCHKCGGFHHTAKEGKPWKHGKRR